MKNVSYKKKTVPEDYKCSVCGQQGSKLWREYQTFCPSLFCVVCAIDNYNKSNEEKISGPDVFDNTGKRPGLYGKTDQIGWLVPAVPDEEGEGYWGYTSVPPEGVSWWRKLPTHV